VQTAKGRQCGFRVGLAGCRYQTRDGPTTPRNRDFLAALDPLKELREVSFGLEGAYGCHALSSS
jgi:hypothetical protein